MKFFLVLAIALVLVTQVSADIADELEDCIGYYIHSSYDYHSSINGNVNGLILELGLYRVKITDYEYLYEYYPTIILLYNPDTKSIKLVIEDEVVDAILLQ